MTDAVATTGGAEISKPDPMLEVVAGITAQIDAEDKEVADLLDGIKARVAQGDIRQGLFEQLVALITLKNQKSEKMLKLLDSMIKMKKVQAGTPTVGINIQMSDSEKKDFIKSL